jgi:glycerol-3-phosphate dehydrogenase
MRYLLYDRATTETSCLDSGYIQKIAPHMIFRIPFLLPLFGGRAFAKLRHETVEAFFSAYDKFQPLKGGKPHVRLSREEALALEPGLDPALAGAVTMDEWGIDTFRLVVANAVDAAEHGAEIHTYSQVTGLLRGFAGEVEGVRVRPREGGPAREVRAKVVVNAAGPWASELARMAGATVRLRPGKGVHLVLERRVANAGIIAEAVDGRSIFVQPHENTTIIGTTDDDYYGDPGKIPITHDEVEYLLEGAARVFPSIREYRILRAFAGVRPTLYADKKYEDELSRRHEVFDHAREGARGLVTIAGGKLASYRIMAEETADHVMALLGRTAACRTHREPLPGGDAVPAPADVARAHGIDRFAAARLVFRHGSRVARIFEEAKPLPDGGRRVICRSEPVTEAEIRYVCRHEWVRSLEDLRRRTRFAEGPCQGLDCVRAGAEIVAEELGWSPDEVDAHVLRFLDARFRERAPVLRGRQLAEEELLQGALFGVEGYDRALPEGDL